MSGTVMSIHGVSAMARQCTARSRSGEQCRRRPIRGGTKCTAHGGATPIARTRAAERLLAAVDPAITELLRLAREGDSDMVKLRATEAILDRAGHPRGVGMPVRSDAEKQADLVAALTAWRDQMQASR